MKTRYDITIFFCVQITLPYENKVNLCRIKFYRFDKNSVANVLDSTMMYTSFSCKTKYRRERRGVRSRKLL